MASVVPIPLQILIILLLYSKIIKPDDVPYDKEKCIISDNSELIEPYLSQIENPDINEARCSSDVLSVLPDAEALAYTLRQDALKYRAIVRRFARREGRPLANTCYQRDGEIQFNLGIYHEETDEIGSDGQKIKQLVCAIYFYGTEGGDDYATDLGIKVIPVEFPHITNEKGNSLRIHEGIHCLHIFIVYLLDSSYRL